MSYRVSFSLLSLGIHVLNLSHPWIELHYSVPFSKFKGVRVDRLSPRETSPAAKSEEKRMFSQASLSSNLILLGRVEKPKSLS